MNSEYIILIILALFILFFLGNFVFFARIKNRTKKAFREVDDYIRRKIELATQIMAEVSKYVSYEKDLVNEMHEAKKKAEQAKTVEEKKAASNLLSVVIAAAIAAAEKHPELKFSQKIKQLKEEIKDMEQGIDSFKDLLAQFVKTVKRLLKTKPFGVIYDLFKKEEKVVKEEIKKVKRKITKKKKTI